jgi:uncharacterized protein (TIGR03435 family)
MNRLLSVTAAMVVLTGFPTAVPVQGQARLTFEAVTIKANKTDSHQSTFGCRGTDSKGTFFPLGRCLAVSTPIEFIIAMVYGVPLEQMNQLISGAPPWLLSDRFDIEAKAESPVPETQLLEMLQTFLEDRFKLKVHRETKEVPVLGLVIYKGGPKLRQAPVPGDGSVAMPNRQNMTASGATMAALAKHLSVMFGRTVLDKTGLTGSYDFALNITEEDPSVPEGYRDSIIHALEDQLGLKIQSEKSLSQVLVVIDHIERPVLN